MHPIGMQFSGMRAVVKRQLTERMNMVLNVPSMDEETTAEAQLMGDLIGHKIDQYADTTLFDISAQSNADPGTGDETFVISIRARSTDVSTEVAAEPKVWEPGTGPLALGKKAAKKGVKKGAAK